MNVKCSEQLNPSCIISWFDDTRFFFVIWLSLQNKSLTFTRLNTRLLISPININAIFFRGYVNQIIIEIQTFKLYGFACLSNDACEAHSKNQIIFVSFFWYNQHNWWKSCFFEETIAETFNNSKSACNNTNVIELNHQIFFNFACWMIF